MKTFLFLACTNNWVPEMNFLCHVLYGHSPSSPRTGRRSCSFALDARTRSESSVPARASAYTNITHVVIPLSLCEYTLFSKSEDRLFLQPVHLSSTRTEMHCRESRTRYLAVLTHVRREFRGPHDIPNTLRLTNSTGALHARYR